MPGVQGGTEGVPRQIPEQEDRRRDQSEAVAGRSGASRPSLRRRLQAIRLRQEQLVKVFERYYIIDLGWELTIYHDHNEWQLRSSVCDVIAEKHNGDRIVSGTGFGYRDMTFEFHTEVETIAAWEELRGTLSNWSEWSPQEGVHWYCSAIRCVNVLGRGIPRWDKSLRAEARMP